MKTKLISPTAIPRALALADRYRLLNEPEQAASIYHDVLAIDEANAEALRDLLLCITEQFADKHGPNLDSTEVLIAKMSDEFEKTYYRGIACERWARAKLQEGAHASFVGSWLKQAMDHYERAEKLSPPENENAILRWNACARLIARIPGLNEEREELHEFGD